MSENNTLLVGVILDVSNSMQKNWKHRAGEKIPRFDVIRDVLNEQIWKISSMSEKRHTEIFCLGMGLQKKIRLNLVDLEKKKETKVDAEQKDIIQTNLVCDLLALSEIIPTTTELEVLERALNDKWNVYAQKILGKVRKEVEGDIYGQLQDYVANGLHESAYDRLYKSWKYRLYVWLQNSSIRRKWTFVDNTFKHLSRYVTGWERKIETSCSKEGEKFFHRIQDHAIQFFKENKAEYVQMIKTMLEEFAAKQIQIILELLTAGHTANRVLDCFDEATAFTIAAQVYDHLNEEVEKKIRIPVIAKLGIFLKDMRFQLRASLDYRELKLLTEKCIQKCAWEILEPFVRETVLNLIEDCFRERARKMFLYWVTIASSREVVKPIGEVEGVLPNLAYEETLRKNYLFGTTPIKEAVNQASIRLLNPKYHDCQKILVVVSDGEFEKDESDEMLRTPIDTMAKLLKQTGVTIICLYVVNRNVVSTLVSKVSSRWPIGSKVMFQIASEVSENEDLANWLFQRNQGLPINSKLFLQINESNLLQEIFDGIFTS